MGLLGRSSLARWVACFDGGFSWKYRSGSSAALLFKGGEKVAGRRNRFGAGEATMNMGEIDGCRMALELALAHEVLDLEVRGDSRFALRAVENDWPMRKSPHLHGVTFAARKARDLLRARGCRVKFVWHSRETPLARVAHGAAAFST